MDLDALRFANFALLDEAITDWTTLVGNLEDLAEAARKGLSGAADKAHWAGVNATVSREFISKTTDEFGDAHTEATSVRNILRDTRDELKDHHRKLNEAIDRGLKKNLTVVSTAGSGFTVTMNIHPDRAAKGTTVPEHDASDVTALRDEVQKILDAATESDRSANTVLQALVDQSRLGFSDAEYADRDTAAHAIKEADELAKLAKKDPEDLTVAEFDKLSRGLKKYANDDLFSEEFATKLGARGTLDFWSGLNAPQENPELMRERRDKFDDLQKSLSLTLANATQSDTGAMTEWKRQIVDLGDKPLARSGGFPLGFQVMSNLMRWGDYDDQFLNDYGTKLFETDKKFTDDGKHTAWHRIGQNPFLNRTKSDGGWDPMTGFLEALGHNPDASTEFFAQPDDTKGMVDKDSEVNGNLKYLTERHWLMDPPLEGGNGKVVAGRDAFGHALEAATTGYAYDATAMSDKDHPMVPGGGDRRTAATAGVMEQVVRLFGSEDGPKMLHEQPELADSLGKMGGAYIDDIDYSLSGIGDHAEDSGDFPAKYAGRANFGNQGAIDFLSVLGQNETSHATVTAAQHLYTLSLLDANPPTNGVNLDHGRDALAMEAEARGILDNSRVQQAETTYGADAEEANKSLGRSADWGKLAAGAIVGGGIATIPLPGSTAAALVIAPLAADTAGEALNTFIGQQVDKSVDDAEDDPREKAQLTSQKFYDKGVNDLGSSFDAYLKNHPEAARTVDHENWKEDIKAGYLGTGSHQNEYRGRPAYKD